MRKESLEKVEEIVDSNQSVCIIGSDLGADTFSMAKKKFPERVLMEGIAEQHIIGFAAGLASNGYYPIVHTIATFLTRRCYEQIAIDLSQQSLSALLLGAGGGMVYAPLGPTHQAIDDFALMGNIPNMKIFAPADSAESTRLIEFAVDHRLLAYMRLGRGGEPIVTNQLMLSADSQIKCKGHPGNFTIVTTGTLLHEALEAHESLEAEGIVGNVIHIPFLNEVGLLKTSSFSKNVFVVEEHIPMGGLASRVKGDFGTDLNIQTRSLPLKYATNYGSQRDHWRANGLCADLLSMWIRQSL